MIAPSQSSFQTKPTPCKPGFALVVTLTLMVLLSILALGLLSLASIELRTAGVGKHDSIARQNAILAMQLAIGELQEHLGPDQRTSANAGLVDSSYEKKNPHWVGAWNTEGGFRNWLVSGNENTTVASKPENDAPAPAHTPGASLATAGSTAPGVVLVGEHSAGSDTGDHVTVPAVEMKAPLSGKTEGRYAWWVGDEGVKANMAATVLELPDASAGTAGKIEFLASSPNRGFPTLGKPWDEWLPDGSGSILESTEGKFVSRRQIPLADAGLSDEEKKRFHDFTVSSAGVMSDSRYGGLKKDLSIAFEIPEKSFANSEFTRVLNFGERQPVFGIEDAKELEKERKKLAYATDHDTPGGRTIKAGPLRGRSTKTAVNYRDPAWDAKFFYRGPTFDQLRNHYQLYRRMDKPFDASGSIAAQGFSPNAPDFVNSGSGSISASIDYFGNQIEFNNLTKGNNHAVEDEFQRGAPGIRVRTLTTELVPEIQHHSYTMALQSYKVPGDPPGMSRVRVINNTFFTLHNPYNVTLFSPPLFVQVARAEVAVELKYPNHPKNKTIKVSLLYPVDSNTGFDVSFVYQDMAHSLSDSGSQTYSPKAITLRPGEIKLYTVAGSKPVDLDTFLGKSRPDRVIPFQQVDPSNPGQLFKTGIHKELRFRYDDRNDPADPDTLPDPYLIRDGDPFTVTVNNTEYIQDGNRSDRPALDNGSNEYYWIRTRLVQPGSNNIDIRQIQMFNGIYWQGKPKNNDNPLTLETLQIEGDINSGGGGSRTYVAQTDNFWKPTSGTPDANFSLATHNPRALVQSTNASGGQGPNSTRGPATWSGSAELLDGSAPNLNLRFWGSSTDPQFGGQEFVTLWDIPRAPLTSIASFGNANLSRLWTSPAYAVGNSYASPYISADKAWRRSGGAPNATNDNYWNLDDSYIFNEALLDSYFFSSLNPGIKGSSWENPLPDSSVRLGSSDPTSVAPLQKALDAWRTGSEHLLNPRMRFTMPSGKSSADLEKQLDLASAYSQPQTSLEKASDMRPHNSIAAYLLSTGSFNVNSTSEEAWRATLAGLRGAAVAHLEKTTSIRSDQSDAKTPFPILSLPGADSKTSDETNLWNGFRSLDDGQIETLARGIVAETKRRVRDRGNGKTARPFTTIAEFVNRRLAPASDKSSMKGVLQTAIDENGLNNTSSLTSNSGQPAEVHHISKKYGPNVQPGAQAETVTVPYANEKALASATIAGTPQWLTQGQILSRIGQHLTARSDTFVIRAYGESITPSDGVVRGRAWLEATVQREPGFVDPSNDPALPLTSPDLTETNKTYGRRFRRVSFRWLSPQEI